MKNCLHRFCVFFNLLTKIKNIFLTLFKKKLNTSNNKHIDNIIWLGNNNNNNYTDKIFLIHALIFNNRSMAVEEYSPT